MREPSDSGFHEIIETSARKAKETTQKRRHREKLSARKTVTIILLGLALLPTYGTLVDGNLQNISEEEVGVGSITLISAVAGASLSLSGTQREVRREAEFESELEELLELLAERQESAEDG